MSLNCSFFILFYFLASSGVVNPLRAKVRKILIRAGLFLLFVIVLLHIIPFRSILNLFGFEGEKYKLPVTFL
ncbi:hypothetical protein C4E24_01040 [ANME-1 cluster archaeon AG-394-G21]|nr:hypothetical protein [ANME-1 cluster archaeon AG-394-G21]